MLENNGKTLMDAAQKMSSKEDVLWVAKWKGHNCMKNYYQASKTLTTYYYA